MTRIEDEWIAILDFGSQYTHLIARRVRELSTFCEITAHDIPADELRERRPIGVILSGGPSSVYEDGSPRCDPGIFDLGVPVLGICYGMQLMVRHHGGTVARAGAREFGRAELEVGDRSDLFRGLSREQTVWMSHGDRVEGIENDWTALATSDNSPFAAVRHGEKPLYGLQFHPEVTHTVHGRDILQNFVSDVCGSSGSWRMSDFVDEEVARIREQVGDKGRVVCGLSGGVDSAVVAAICHKALGDRLECVFVDNGLLRKGERTQVVSTFRDHFKAHLHVSESRDRFLEALRGVTDPEDKRKKIGNVFIDAFKAEVASIENDGHGPIAFLAQGTLYPDVIESAHPRGGPSATIKTHHNVGGLPDELGFELVEPIRLLFKDEVRAIGTALGLPPDMVWRHPFPGPGLAIRVLGEVSEDRLAVLREADAIVREEIEAAGLSRQLAQVFAVLLPVKAVGVMGDGRTYEDVIAVRAVTSEDFMTADWAYLPEGLMRRLGNRIINEVRGVNRVTYDISSKPPATIEWE